MDMRSAPARLILVVAAASLAACLQTPQPIPPGVDLDATTDAAIDAPGLDAYDDAVSDPVAEVTTDAADEPIHDVPTDTDIGDVIGDAEDDAENDVEDDAVDDVEDDAVDDAGDVDGPDAT
ncbi:MAG: hypothetical protein JRG91_09625 [Deltaproteobacteria bacterium]|nr:hypothetical protein [Deltaproteobacteria bacterium]